MAIAERAGLPISIRIASASPHETKLVEATLDARFTQAQPKLMIGDKAYDSNGLDERLRDGRGIQMIAPHRKDMRRVATQDGRPLRRYVRRWKVERLFAWLHNFRRIVVRWDYYAEHFQGFVQLACVVILLKHF
jgi:transposase